MGIGASGKHGLLWDAYLSVDDGTEYDLSPDCRSIQLQLEGNDISLVAMGDKFQNSAQGIRGATVTANIYNSFYANDNLDNKLFSWQDNDTSLTIQVRASKTAAISTNNPEYQFTARISNYSPLGSGDHGAELTTPVTFILTGGGAANVTRNTS